MLGHWYNSVRLSLSLRQGPTKLPALGTLCSSGCTWTCDSPTSVSKQHELQAAPWGLFFYLLNHKYIIVLIEVFKSAQVLYCTYPQHCKTKVFCPRNSRLCSKWESRIIYDKGKYLKRNKKRQILTNQRLLHKDCCTKLFLFQRAGVRLNSRLMAKLWKALSSISSKAKTKTKQEQRRRKETIQNLSLRINVCVCLCVCVPVHTHIHDPHTHDPKLILKNTVLWS